MKTDSTLIDYVYAIADLPELPPILLENSAELTLIQIDKGFWQAISLWLRNLVLAEPLSPEAYKGISQYYQPYAEFFTALLQLVVAVYSGSGNPALRQFPSPAALWYYLIKLRARHLVENSGLFGSLPSIASKRENYLAVTEVCSHLEKHKWKPSQITKDENLEDLLYTEAQVLAKAEKRFHYSNLLPFLRVWRQTNKEVKHCRQLQNFALLPDGTLFSTEKGRKLPPGL